MVHFNPDDSNIPQTPLIQKYLFNLPLPREEVDGLTLSIKISYFLRLKKRSLSPTARDGLPVAVRTVGRWEAERPFEGRRT
jgi:hypothetical protein